MPATDLADLTAAELVRRIAAGHATARQAVDASLERIERHDADVNAFSVVLGEEARAEADRLDGEAASGGGTGPLHGVPVAIKEEIDVAGCVTTFGGRGNSTPARSGSRGNGEIGGVAPPRSVDMMGLLGADE